MQPFLCSKAETQRCHVKRRTQEGFSTDDSPTVKARLRTCNLVSEQCWSGKQSSSTSDSTIPGSTRTEGVSSSIGKPLSDRTSNISMLGSQVDGLWLCLPCTLQFRLCRCLHCSRSRTGIVVVFLVFDVAHTVPVSVGYALLRMYDGDHVRGVRCASRVRGNRVLECLC